MLFYSRSNRLARSYHSYWYVFISPLNDANILFALVEFQQERINEEGMALPAPAILLAKEIKVMKKGCTNKDLVCALKDARGKKSYSFFRRNNN